ncbi:hypothetical protein SAY86_021789 [Trapa natans]|uniref:Uncharacterized protein n=1 Tax=Trapa natans TaxID=22666 RepID=A0AAN7RF18_TRANT|nr:hypothetical protein SAY86_021789 [Trapa natans]
MDRNPHAHEELIKRMKGPEESSSPSGPKPPPFQYHEIPSTFSGALSYPWEAERGSLGFMDLLSIQDYASATTLSEPYSLLDLIQPPLPPPPEQPARSELLPVTASSALEPSEVVNNQSPTLANSSSLSPSSDEGPTNKPAEQLGEEAEEEERSINEERTRKQLGPLRPMLPGGPKGLARHGPCFWTVPIISRFEVEIEPHDRDMVLLSKSTQAELTTSLKGSISGDDAGERAGHLRR